MNDCDRFNDQFRETEDERNERLAKARKSAAFKNRVASLYNLSHRNLPELTDAHWLEFIADPARYFINRADKVQAEAIFREVERRQ